MENLTDEINNHGETQLDAEKIFKSIDRNGSGRIDFLDFQWAAIDIETVLTPEKLKCAFEIFANRQKNAAFITKDQMIEFFDADSEIVDIRRSSAIIQDSGWDLFF